MCGKYDYIIYDVLLSNSFNYFVTFSYNSLKSRLQKNENKTVLGAGQHMVSAAEAGQYFDSVDGQI